MRSLQGTLHQALLTGAASTAHVQARDSNGFQHAVNTYPCLRRIYIQKYLLYYRQLSLYVSFILQLRHCTHVDKSYYLGNFISR